MRFAARMVSGAFAVIMSQYSRVAFSNSATGTTLCTRPMCLASSALNWRAVIMISSAAALPTISTRFFMELAR